MVDLTQPDTPTPSESSPPAASLNAGHELRDIRFRPILWAGGALIVAAVVVHLGMLLLLNAFAARESKESAPASPLAGAYGLKAPPDPRLQTNPVADIAHIRAAEDAALSTYGWIDRQAGIARIPIDRAIELVAEPEPAASPAAAQAAGSGGR